MDRSVRGIHHVTAIAGDPPANLEFYTAVLGLRFVKKAVNYDDPATWHLYYGDGQGRPGSILTFFPWGARAPRGRPGVGQLTLISFSVPIAALDFWRERLAARGVPAEPARTPFGEEALRFRDPDGIALELVGSEADDRAGWSGAGVPAEQALRGFHSVLLSEADLERTAALMVDRLGFREIAGEGPLRRYEAGEGGPGTYVDVAALPEGSRGVMGVGAVHHVAWRVSGDEEQRALRGALAEAGANVTPVIDRTYFRSIYFREPGGVLFEAATDPPGFTVDEPQESLGTRLMLPQRLEQYRRRIEESLPPLERAPGERRQAS